MYGKLRVTVLFNEIMDDTETIQVVTGKDGSKYEEKEQITAIQSPKLLVIVTDALEIVLCCIE